MLLYSAMQTDFTGRYSFLGLQPDAHIRAEDFTLLEHALAQNEHSSPLNRWFGYLGYELKHALEQLPKNEASSLALPALWMTRYRLLLVFDHHSHHITVWAKEAADMAHLPCPSAPSPATPPFTSGLTSNMTKAQYLQKVETIKQAIAGGELYQANLTRKFSGTLQHTSPAELFRSLCTTSPSPYSALLHYGDSAILSSSPEQFITIGEGGIAVTRPIKGSAARFADSAKDEASKLALMQSEKNRAENLMIVDLMRNDLARNCEPGSVKVESLFDCTSYATIHHLSSTISAHKKADRSALALIQGCFPPGSMTGTPKIRAMELCSRLEQQQRGVYSGCIGWIDPDYADFSVVIRTLILQGDRFEFQVGGAIVADSDAQEEWQETLIKARGIAAILGIPISALEAL
jgi:aminodeoxychorismate synthase component I